MVPGQPGQKLSKIHFNNNKNKKLDMEKPYLKNN
jgi:hypothetical protein